MSYALSVFSQRGLTIKKYAISLCVLCIFAATTATTHAQMITGMDPCSAARPSSLTVTITGENTTFFQGSSTVTSVWLSKGSSRIDAFSFTGIDANSLSASFDIPADANIGTWDVHVSDPVDGELLPLTDGFTIYTYPDLDGDGKVDSKDFAFFSRHWLEGVTPQDMVLIPGGTFQMGNSKDPDEGWSNELPVHTVTLDSFAMGKYEITNGQYCAFLNSAYPSQLKVVNGIVYASGDTAKSFNYCVISPSNPYTQIAFSNNSFSVRTKGGRDMSKDPMVEVSWYGAVAYCNWRSQQDGKQPCYNLSTWNCDFTKKGYRLPTEAEWEYAARGELVGQRFPWGDTITHSQANYFSNSSYSYDTSLTHDYHPTWNDGTSPVGSFPANSYGLCDMAGNVWELCNDWKSDTYYSSCPINNPIGPIAGSGRVLRGGGWGRDAYFCRVSGRHGSVQVSWGSNLGFRAVLDF